jgi:hypothetical protein
MAVEIEARNNKPTSPQPQEPQHETTASLMSRPPFRKNRKLTKAQNDSQRRRRLVEALNRVSPAWDPADHPDIEEAGGAAAWVRKMRLEADKASMRRIRSKRQ